MLRVFWIFFRKFKAFNIIFLKNFLECWVFDNRKYWYIKISHTVPPNSHILWDQKSGDYMGMCDCDTIFQFITQFFKNNKKWITRRLKKSSFLFFWYISSLLSFAYSNSHIFVRTKRVWLFEYVWLFRVWLVGGCTGFTLYLKNFLRWFEKPNMFRVLTFFKKQFLNPKFFKPGVCTWSLISLNNLSTNEKNDKIQKSN